MKKTCSMMLTLLALAALPAAADEIDPGFPGREPSVICKNEKGETVVSVHFGAGPRGVDVTEIVRYGQTHEVLGGYWIHDLPHTRAGYTRVYRSYLPAAQLFGAVSFSKDFRGPRLLDDGKLGYALVGIRGQLYLDGQVTPLACEQ